MVGKASIWLVLGFSSLFMIYNSNLLSFENDSIEAFGDYYTETVATNIARSGANMANNLLFLSPNWTTGFDNIAYSNGTLNVTVNSLTGNKREIVSEGTFNGVTKTIRIVLQPSNFAKFGNFYDQLSAAPATGDTFDGPFHSNDYLNVYGDPVFLGKTTCKKGIKKWYTPSNPQFLGGFETGVNLPLTFNSTDYSSQASGGKLFQGVPGNSFVDVDLTFNIDGTVTHKSRLSNNGISWDPWSSSTTEPLTAMAPNGLIYIDKGNITVRGTLSGRTTIATSKKGGNKMGNIYIDNDLVYKTNPLVAPSTDLLGLVAEDKITVTYDNSRGDINIHATMFSSGDGLNIERYSDYTSINSMKIVGGLIAKTTKATAVYSHGNPIKGYRYVHKFDDRFLTQIPPFFPTTGGYEIISWYE